MDAIVLSPAAHQTLGQWHRMVETGDTSVLPDILADDITFRSPFVWTPYTDKPTILHLLRTVITVFEDFRYHRTFANPTGCVLEFSARVGERKLFGVDLIEFDGAGRMTDFTVMVRPGSGLEALAAEMGRRLEAKPA